MFNGGCALIKRGTGRVSGILHVHANSSVALISPGGARCRYGVSLVARNRIAISVVSRGPYRGRPSIFMALCRTLPGNSGVSFVIRGYARLKVDEVIPVVSTEYISHPSRGSLGGGYRH